MSDTLPAHLVLPAGVEFIGRQPSKRRGDYLAFNETATETTFMILEAEATTKAIEDAVLRAKVSFSQGGAIPKVRPPQPQPFTAPASNHY